MHYLCIIRIELLKRLIKLLDLFVLVSGKDNLALFDAAIGQYKDLLTDLSTNYPIDDPDAQIPSEQVDSLVAKHLDKELMITVEKIYKEQNISVEERPVYVSAGHVPTKYRRKIP